MKRKKVTCFTSLTLAALLTVSSITGSAVNVFATSGDDSIQITTETDNDEIVIENNSEDITISEPKPSDNIVPSTPESTEPNPADEIVIQDIVKSSISLKKDASDTDEIIIENDDSHVAGEEIPVYVKAENPSDTEVELQISFWSGVEKLEDIQSEDLTDIANDITIKEFQKDTKISIDLQSEDKTIKSEANLVQEKDENDNLTKYDISVKMPAKTSADMTFHITSDTAQMVTVVPCMGDTYGTAVHAVWTEADEIEIKDTETESQTEPEIIIEEEKIEDSFPSVYLGDTDLDTATLNASDFASMRLVLFTEDESVIPNESDILSQHDNIYLLQFTSIQQTMNAYAYFKRLSLPVEPDMPVEAAGEDTHNEIVVSKDALQISENENPIDTLNDILSDKDISDDEVKVQDDNVIALIDTGVGESPNVIERISVIDDVLTSTGHGDSMLQAITSQNPDAKVLSIRAMNDNGLGTISSLVAAMEYAMNKNVDMINLSLYARTTLSTSVLKSEIQKAVDAGITVIGAAGNDGVDVADYVPGSVESAYIIGAANEDGSRLKTSNFGATVDYNVVGDSTSEATALFTGYISKNGLDKVSEVLNQGMIFETDYTYVREPIEDTGEVFPVEFSVDGNMRFVFSNLDGSLVKNVELSNETKTVDIPMTGVHVNVIADETEILSDISVVDNSGSDVIDVKTPKEIPDWMKGVRNAFFTLDEMQEIKISAKSENMNEEMPMFDEIAQRTYFESVLCDENCLEEHVRKDGSDDGVDISANRLGEDDIMAAGGIPIGSGGLCEIWFVPRPGGDWHNLGSFNVQFHDGDLAGNYVTGFTCITHGAANPGHGGNPAVQMIYGDYTVQSATDNHDGTVTYYVTVHCKDTNGNYSEPMGYQNIAGYITIKNPKGGLSVWKYTGNRDITNNNSNYSLVGAKFNVYKEDGTFVQTIKTNKTEWYDGWEYGVASTADDALDAGRYYVQETKASPGYTVNNEKAYVDVVAGQNARANYTYFAEPPKTGEGKLEKKSDNPAMTDGNKCYTLAGAVYGVWKDSSCSGAPWKRMTTDENGYAKADKLPFGTYYVQEITPSKGFELDPEMSNGKYKTITITEANPKAKINSVEPAGNDPMVITINKILNGPETPTISSLAGTQFTVKYYDNMNKNTSGTPTKTWVLEVKKNKRGEWMCMLGDDWLVRDKSDDFYRDPDTNDVLLPYGTYHIQETKAAPGYTLEGELKDGDGNVIGSMSKPYIAVVRKGDTGIHLDGGNEYKGNNKPHDTSIKIRKVDENGKPLAGAKFKLVDSNGKLVSTKTSGADGYVTWDKLYPDRYYVTEIKTADGKNLLKDGLTIELPRRVTEEDIKKYNIDRSKLSEWDKKEKCYYLFDVTYEISNHATFEAPSTGGFTDFMTFLPLVGGMAGLTGVGVVTMKKKRKKRE